MVHPHHLVSPSKSRKRLQPQPKELTSSSSSATLQGQNTLRSPNRPAQTPPPPTRKGRVLSLRSFFLRWARRAKRVVNHPRLPWVAHQICHTYIDNDQPHLQATCQHILKMRLELNPSQLGHFLHTPIGDAVLNGLDYFFQSEEVPWRTTLVNMAADPGGISLFSALRHLPKSLQLNGDRVLATAQNIDHLIQETETLVAHLEQTAHQPANQAHVPNFSQWPDLRQPGPFAVDSHCFSLQGQQDSQAIQKAGFAADSIWSQQRGDRHVNVWLYCPRPWPDHPVPVVVLSHGLASAPDDLVVYARHLASHGYAIALPQHPGSDSTYTQQMLAGKKSAVFDPMEFIHRPLDISDLLDELEHRNRKDYGHHLNLKQVGLMGSSFGAYTALVVAGASLDLTQLAHACQVHPPEPNLSLLLQCRAKALPLKSFTMRDPRIAAVITLDAVGSQTLKLETIPQIDCPVMMVAGHRDITAPLVLEQLRLFHHLNPAHRYLGLIRGKCHLRNWHKLQTSLQLEMQIFPQPSIPETPLFDRYIQALSLAFFQAYLDPQATASVYLQSAYGQYLSQPPFNLLFLNGDQL